MDTNVELSFNYLVSAPGGIKGEQPSAGGKPEDPWRLPGPSRHTSMMALAMV